MGLMTLGGLLREPGPCSDRAGYRILAWFLIGEKAAIMLGTGFGTILLRLWACFVAKQSGHDLLWRADKAIDRVHATQGRHSAIAGPLQLVESRDSQGVLLHQRHAFGVGGLDQQSSLVLQHRRGQLMFQKLIGLT